MICPRCNTQTDDNTAVCPVCSAPLAEEREQAAAEKNEAKDEKVYYGYGKEFSKTKYNKRKRRRRAWSVILPIAVVAVVAAVVLFNLDFIIGFYKKTFCSPTEYFEYVARRNMGDDHAADVRECLSDISAASKGAVEVRIDTDAYEAYREDTKRENRMPPSYVIDGLDRLAVQGASNETGTNIGIYTADRPYLTFELAGDYDKDDSVVPVDIEDGYFTFYDAKVTADELDAALPDKKALDELAEKYLDIMFSHCTGVRKATEEFGIGGVDQKLVMLEVNFGRTDMLNFKKEMITEFGKDKAVIKILKNIEAAAKKAGRLNDHYDIMKSFDAEIERVLAEIEEARTNVGIIVNTLRYRVFVDGGHSIVGREITVNDTRAFYYLTTVTKEEFALEFKIDTMTGTGYGTIDDGKLNGTVNAEDDGVEMMDIDIKELDMSDGITGGKLVFKPKTRLIHDIGLPTDFSRLGVVWEAAFAEDKTIINIKSTQEIATDE